jgi:hypothetical protein
MGSKVVSPARAYAEGGGGGGGRLAIDDGYRFRSGMSTDPDLGRVTWSF